MLTNNQRGAYMSQDYDFIPHNETQRHEVILRNGTTLCNCTHFVQTGLSIFFKHSIPNKPGKKMSFTHAEIKSISQQH